MKEKKYKLLPIIIGIVFVVAILLGYYILNRQDENTTLTLLEKQWIENNKNKVFDYAFLNNIPVFNIDGVGVTFDFINDIEDATNLEFNKISYTVGNNLKTEYAFKIVDKKEADDLLLFQDHYVLVSKDKVKYNSQEEISNIVVGVLDDNVASVNNYLKDANVTYKTYVDVDAMLLGLETEVNAVVLPRVKYLDSIIGLDLNISYHIIEMKQDYVFSLGTDKKLNTIISKYFKKWFNEQYKDSYNHHLTNNYLDFKVIDSKEEVKFRSKRYVYGFINNLPYDFIKGGDLGGINSELLKDFTYLAGVEISFKQYNSLNDMLNSFNSNDIDFFYNLGKDNEYKLDVVSTVDPLINKLLIVSPTLDSVVINSLQSLKGLEVSVLKDSAIAKTLKSVGASIKEYTKVIDLINSKNLMAIDYETYTYYSKTTLKNFEVDYETVIDGNTFVLRDIKANNVFNDYFNFYLQYIDAREVVSLTYNNILTETGSKTLLTFLVNSLGYILFVSILGYEGYRYFNRQKRKEPALTKADKLKYVDLLTSLKNRNYLNDNIEKWDSSDIYPQTIVIADLNNVAYINDNYGYQEGDKVIREAANILINNQVENSDIIRTNGNEFLIYMVGYDEKQVTSYIRKLSKEFKNLSHDFGAALGYSMINDAIKTVDDAINEATLDMRTNKEEENDNE